MYYFKLGVTGATISTVVSQYIVTCLMIWHLNKRAVLLPLKLGSLQFGGYLKSGGFLLGRTLAVLITTTTGTSMATRQGPLAMDAHQICLQVWLDVSLMTDALAASGQIGFGTYVLLTLILGVSFSSLAILFTKYAKVLAIVRTRVLFVSANQPINALAFIFYGLHYGVSDLKYAACSMSDVKKALQNEGVEAANKLVHGGKEHSPSWLIGRLIRNKGSKSKSSATSTSTSCTSSVPDQYVSDLTTKIQSQLQQEMDEKLDQKVLEMMQKLADNNLDLKLNIDDSKQSSEMSLGDDNVTP